MINIDDDNSSCCYDGAFGTWVHGRLKHLDFKLVLRVVS